MENIFTSNWINRQVAKFLLLIANPINQAYDSVQECFEDVDQSLNKEATPLDRHTTLQIEYLWMIVLPWALGVLVLIPTSFITDPSIRSTIVAIFSMIAFPMTIMAAYFSLRSWPAKNAEAEWMANGYDDTVKANPYHDYLNFDYFIIVPLSVLLTWLVVKQVFNL